MRLGSTFVLVRPQCVEFGRIDLFDARAAAGVHRIDGPHTLTGFAGGFRSTARASRQIFENGGPARPATGSGHELADPLENVAQPFAAFPDHSIELVGVESESTVLAHATSLAFVP